MSSKTVLDSVNKLVGKLMLNFYGLLTPFMAKLLLQQQGINMTVSVYYLI